MENGNTEKQHKKQYDWLKGYQFVKGVSGNPNGRPPGKSLKTFVREYLEALPDDEKVEYIRTLDPEMVWKMAEGNPATNTDITSGGKSINQFKPVKDMSIEEIDEYLKAQINASS